MGDRYGEKAGHGITCTCTLELSIRYGEKADHGITCTCTLELSIQYGEKAGHGITCTCTLELSMVMWARCYRAILMTCGDVIMLFQVARCYPHSVEPLNCYQWQPTGFCMSSEIIPRNITLDPSHLSLHIRPQTRQVDQNKTGLIREQTGFPHVPRSSRMCSGPIHPQLSSS